MGRNFRNSERKIGNRKKYLIIRITRFGRGVSERVVRALL